MGYETAMQAAGANVIAFQEFGSYQGDWWAKVEYNGKVFWVHDYYGSCSGCDSFEAEFGYDDQKCSDHKYDYNSPESCEGCKAAQLDYQQRLAKFGRDYLDGSAIHDQESAEKKAAENEEWDSDAAEVVAFIKANSLSQ